MALSLSSASILQKSLEEFQIKFNSKVPLELEHCSKFLDEIKIRALATHVRIPIWREFMQRLSNLTDPDDDAISGAINGKFDIGVRELINEAIVKHHEYEAKAASFFEKQMNRICEDAKGFIEDNLLAKPEMDTNEFHKLVQDSKSVRILCFESLNNGGIWESKFFEGQIEKFKQMLDILHNQIAGNHRNRFDLEDEAGCASASTCPIEPVRMECVILGNENLGDEQNAATTSGLSNQRTRIPVRDIAEPNDEFFFEIGDEAGTENSSDMDLNRTNELNITEQGSSDVSRDRKRRYQCQDQDEEATFTGKSSRRSRNTPSPIPCSPSDELECPLIFRLASDSLSVGTRDGDNFKMCDPEGVLPAVVAVDQTGKIVCGVDALNCQERFSLSEYLVGDTPEEKIIHFTTLDGGNVISLEMCAEFILGVLIKFLKDNAETHFNRTFRYAIIIIPIWFHSVQRVQMKTAAETAGFPKVDLINQESLAVYAYCSLRGILENSDKIKCNILVLVENLGIISAVRYHDTGNKSNYGGTHRLVMSTDRYEYKRIEATKDKNPFTRMEKIFSLCRQFRSKSINLINTEEKVLIVMESQEWKESFTQIAIENDLKGVVLQSSEMFGGSILACVKVWDINSAIGERLLCLLESCSIEPPIWLPMRVKCELPLHSFEDVYSQTVSQASVKPDVLVELGKLEFNGSSSQDTFAKCKVILTFFINLDATVSYMSIQVEKVGKTKKASSVIHAYKFIWKPNNLSDEDRQNMKHLVSSIL